MKEKLNELKAKQKDNIATAFKANVNTPAVNQNGEIFRASDGKPYPTEKEFFKDFNVKSIAEAYAKGLITDVDQGALDEQSIVSNLAQEYFDAGIKPGMSLAEASALAKTSKIFNKKVSDASGGGGLKIGDYPTPDKIKDFILKVKQANPDVPYYEVWGKIADELKSKGFTPSNFDQQFWEVLHPEGLTGYKKTHGSASGDLFNQL